MDSSVAERLSSLAAKTDAFAKLEPEQLSQRDVSAAQMAAVLGLVTARPDVQVVALARALGPKTSRLRWAQVFVVSDTATGEYPLMLGSVDSVAALVAFLGTISPEAVHAVLAHKWTTLSIQTSLLAGIMAMPQQQLRLASFGIEKVVNDGPLVLHPMNFVPVIHLALDAVVREPPTEIMAKSFLDGHVKAVPELFLLGGVTIPDPWPPVLERILINLYALYFSEIADPASPVLARLASLNPRFMYLASLDLYARDASELDRIALAAHNVGLLDSWLDQVPSTGYGFTLELIATADRLTLASAKDLLVSKVVTGGPDAIIALLDFMEIKIAAAAAIAAGSAPPPDGNLLSLRTVAAFETLTSSIDVPPDRMEQLKAIQIQCLQTYPRLINFGQGHDDAILANNDLPTFPTDVEQEMKLWFQKMYEQQIEIRDIISLLERLKDSDEPRDQDLFACMAHSLFDEYRFFPEYPVNALATTAVLFGSLIRFRLIDNIPLSIALRFILESLRQPVETNMFRFGLQALFELRQRLPEFPKYCSVLLTIPGLVSQQQFYQQIKDIVYPTSSLELAAQENTFKSLNAEVGTPLTSSVERPSEQVQDKVLFVVNNLSQHNVKSKSKELVGILDQRFYGWFAQYIVGERAISEPNYHALYISMLSSINSQNLLTQCCHVVYLHVIRIVNHADVLTQELRIELKNLGSFLGSLMLANNRPILHDNINFKLLLAEAVLQEKLTAVLPFVCKTLEKAADSLIFAPPNAWLMSLMTVLSELYLFGGLKLNLKFEIEVLCNALGLQIDKISPSTFIRSNDAVQLEKDMTTLHIEEPAPAATPPVGVPGHAGMLPGAAPGHVPPLGVPNPPNPPTPGVPGAPTGPVAPSYGPGVLQLVGNTEFVSHPTLRRLFELAISKTIQEVLLPVVDRSASIASYTAKELVTKDFALEADEHKLQLAAHNLSAILAMSMSLVTAKDPFVESLATNLRTLMLSNGYGEHNMLMDQIPIAARDNVEVIIPLVESAAREKAITDVDEALIPSYNARQRFHQAGGAHGDHVFTDQLYSKYSSTLPDPLALRPGGLLPAQLAVYDDFALVSEPPGFALEAPNGTPHALLEQGVHQIQSFIENLERLVSESSETSLADLQPDNRILLVMSQILSVATRSAVRDDVILKTSQIVVSSMFSSGPSELCREVMCFLLGKLCELSSVTAKEVVLWLIYSDDERKYNVQVMGTLIRSKLISAIEIDVNLAKEILNHNPNTINFAAGLILDSVLGPVPYSLRTEYTGSLEALEVLSREDPPNQAAKNVLAALHKSRGEGWKLVPESAGKSNASALASANKHNEALKNKMGYVFAEWTRLVQHPCVSERSLHIFVYGLAEQNLLSHTEPLYTLIRTALEASVDSYKHSVDENVPSSELFVGVDSLAKLLITILQTSDRMPVDARLQYAQGIFMVLSLVLARDHESEQEYFNGKPYFRLWSSILFQVSEADDGSPFWEELLLLIAEILEMLQPIALPAFTSSWITLISHRHLMTRLLSMPEQKGWMQMYQLFAALIRFVSLYSDGKELSDFMAITYKGMLRIFLVILHDFPEFLAANHWSFISVIPSSFVQLRNLVLSAFPSHIEIPNPLAAPESIKVDYSNIPGTGLVDIPNYLNKIGARKNIDAALQPRPGSLTPQVVGAISSALALNPRKREYGVEFDSIGVSVPGYNALAIYVASTVAYKDGEYDEDSPQAMLSLRLLSTLNAEARYFYISAMVNQLRYPNQQTLFYSKLLLSLFLPFASPILKDSASDIKHIVARVLLERIISNRPHPWGLMATFSQLLSDKRYKFWELPFVKVAPEIEQMFTSLYQHINPQAA